jgi:hypothetical protein
VCSERFLIWLLALDPIFVKHVWIMGASSSDEFDQSLTTLRADLVLVNAALSNIGSQKWSFTTRDTPTDGAILLVSGSLSFVTSWTAKVSTPILVLCDKHIRSRKMSLGGSLRWMLL